MNLKEASFSAGRWTTASTSAAVGLQVVQTIVLARILLPADFGLMSVVASFIAILALIVDLGLSQALIHYDDVSTRERSSIYWLNMLLALVLMAALVVAAPMIGKAFRSEQLVPLLGWSSLMFPLTAIGQQLRALAAKSLRFKQLAPIEVLSTMAGMVSAVIAACMNCGVYSLVVGLLVRAGTSSSLAWILLPSIYRPRFHFRLREAIPYLGFGGYSTGEALANELHRNADVFAGGLAVGPAAMGVYTVPRDLSMRMSSVLNGVVTKVGFPVMSQVKGEPDRLRNIYLQTLRMTASVNFPLYVVIGLFAEEIISLLYGPRWHDAATYLRVLSAWGLIRSTSNPIGSLLYATGRTRQAFLWNLALLLILPPLYWIASRTHGLHGLASGALLIQALLVFPAWLLLVRPCCGATFREYLSQFSAPLFCASSAGLFAWVAASATPTGTLRLAIGGTLAGLAYFGLSFAFNRRWTDAMMQFFRPTSTRRMQ